MDLKIVVGGTIHTNNYIVIDEDTCVIIDYTPEVLSFITSRNLTPLAVLITHIHFDHIEGLSEFISKYNTVPIYLSTHGKNRINDPNATLNTFMPYHIDTDSLTTVNDGDTLTFGAVTFDVSTTPGHSPDSVSYYSPALHALFPGDVIFFRSVGRTDFPGSSHTTLLQSINKLFEKYPEYTALYPGHGPKTTIVNEKKYNSFLTSFT